MAKSSDGSGTVIIKKYANRRLYNTETSSYITLDHLAAMTREGRDFKVIDTKTNTVTDTIALGGQPNECAATLDGHYVVVPLLAPANSAVIVDMVQKKIVKTLQIGRAHV